MRKRKKVYFQLQRISQGIILTILFMAAIFLLNKDSEAGEMLLRETVPFYPVKSRSVSLFKFADEGLAGQGDDLAELDEYATGGARDIPQPDMQEVFRVDRVEESINLDNVHGVIGLGDVILQPETDHAQAEHHIDKEILTMADMDRLRDLQYAKQNFYIVDSRTDLTAQDYDVDRFLQTDLGIDNSMDGPKVLIFHTHSQEGYRDSDPADPMDGVMGAGKRLAEILTEKYGIETMHHTGRYDIIDGKSQVMGAYERMEPSIEKILADNPSIQVAIDLHRDGVQENTRLVTDINGKPTAQIMFFNGLSKLKNDGVLSSIDSLPNPHLPTNLAFSFHMQVKANSLYPQFTRKVYLNAYRYSLNMLPKSLLVEVGAQTNTKDEGLNAMEPLAELLVGVIR